VTAVVVVRDPRGRNLNMRQLLTPIFYSREVRHPDATRQRGSRQRAKDMAAARRLKARYVPLCFVDRTVYLDRYNPWADRWEWGAEVRNA
jgi:hypothetical protein